jgi:hypothetical protein
MANYIFKQEAEVYLVHDSIKYRVDISEISFGQTFQEKSYEVKTIHNQVGFEGSNINTANPAEFSFNTPLLEEAKHKVVFDRLLDCATFDLYISSGQDVFKLEKCVIQDGTFEINKSRPLRLSISGEASKLSKFSGAIPGSSPVGITQTITYIVPQLTTLNLGGTDISRQATAVTVEVQNDITWNKYNTVQGAISATNAATSMYPNTFTIGTRVVAGSITKYLKSAQSFNVLDPGTGEASDVLDSTSNTDLLTWNTDISLDLKAGVEYAGGTFYGIRFNFTNCSFTNRFQDGEVFMEEYSWRLTQRPDTLDSVITYDTK